MNNNLPSYDSISMEILKLLTNLSDHINRIMALNNSLFGCYLFNGNCNFIKYIYHFDIVRYYHFRCMGYMEALILTKCYSIDALCHWNNMLIMPKDENLTVGVDYLNLLESDCEISSNPLFKILIHEFSGLSDLSNEIMTTIESYDLPC